MAKLLTRHRPGMTLGEEPGEAVWVQQSDGTKESFDLVGKLREGSLVFAGQESVRFTPKNTATFTNTRPQAEDAAVQLTERYGFDYVMLDEDDERRAHFYLEK